MIKRIAKIAALGLVTGSLSFVTAAPASAQAPDPNHPQGRRCSFNSSIAGAPEGSQTGQQNGGPITHASVAAGAIVIIRCKIVTVNSHAAAAQGDSDVAGSIGAVSILEPRVMTYVDADVVYQCTSVAVIIGAIVIVWYWNGIVWVITIAEVCVQALSVTIPPDEVNDIIESEVDPILCEILIGLDGSALDVPPVDIRADGDVYINGELVWDCPPYIIV